MILAPGRPLTLVHLAWCDHYSRVRLGGEVGRAHHGRWFAYVNVSGKNYWLRRYS